MGQTCDSCVSAPIICACFLETLSPEYVVCVVRDTKGQLCCYVLTKHFKGGACLCLSLELHRIDCERCISCINVFKRC